MLPATTVQFTALLDPRFFVAGGRHSLEVFEVDTTAEERVLRLIATATADDGD